MFGIFKPKKEKIAEVVYPAVLNMWRTAFGDFIVRKQNIPTSAYYDPYILGFVGGVAMDFIGVFSENKLNKEDMNEILAFVLLQIMGKDSVKSYIEYASSDNEEFIEGSDNSNGIVFLTSGLISLELYKDKFKKDNIAEDLQEAIEHHNLMEKVSNDWVKTNSTQNFTDAQKLGFYLLKKNFNDYIKEFYGYHLRETLESLAARKSQ